MKKVLLLFVVAFFILSITAQNAYLPFTKNNSLAIGKEVIRTINSESASGLEIEYEFPGATVSQKTENNKTYHFLHVDGFSDLHEVCKP